MNESLMFILDTSGRWSARASRFLNAIPTTKTVYGFYLWHITHCGTGYKKLPNVGKKTYQEVCDNLIISDFPDPDDEIFRLGYDSNPQTQAALVTLLDSWKSAPIEKRASLRFEFAQWCAE